MKPVHAKSVHKVVAAAAEAAVAVSSAAEAAAVAADSTVAVAAVNAVAVVAGIPVTDVVVAGIVATAINPSATTDDQGLPLWRLFLVHRHSPGQALGVITASGRVRNKAE
jgi:hypothetical protein